MPATSSHVKVAAPRAGVKGKVTFKAQNRAPVASGSAPRRKRSAPPSDDERDEDDEGMDDDEDEEADVESEADTDDELAAARNGKSKKTAKRKRRATSPSTFGAALEGLLGKADEEKADDDGSEEMKSSTLQGKGQSTILSLAPHIRRSAQSSRLNEKASRLAVEAKKKREERARVKDVIGGWGAPGQLPKTLEGNDKEEDDSDDGDEQVKEWTMQGGAQGYEKRLRKVAQRGVVKLFNAIRAAQGTTEEDVDLVKGTKKEETSSKAALSNSLKGENALGAKGRAVQELSKNNFFDLIRGGAKAAAH
ncbi:hypothetical protein CBS101457_000656 [Exobasidium rhododendri]|nr:hypothetical protein CBS101457_000656 [Exobasidium rhododendri]